MVSKKKDKIGVVILGSTGSIGKSTLKVIKNYPTEIEIVCMSSNKNFRKLYKSCGCIDKKILSIRNSNKK